MTKKFNAAKSLFNSTDNAPVESREQTVLTPEWLLDAIRAVAPIGLDPCTTPENPTGAGAYYFLPRWNGLEERWDYGVIEQDSIVYVNPPYDSLKLWLKKCEGEAFHGTKIYLLAPFRPQRKWFVDYTKGCTVASLAPFPFVGHKSAFPAPLCLVCYNLPVPNLGKYLTGVWNVH